MELYNGSVDDMVALREYLVKVSIYIAALQRKYEIDLTGE